MTVRPFAVGFLSPHDPFDRTVFSGTAHYAAAALGRQPGVALRTPGGHRPRRAADRFLRRPAPEIDPAALDLRGLDAVVGLVATELLDAVAGRGVPCLHVTDATPAFLREAYGWDIPAEADAAEARVARSAARVAYSSAAIAARARADLGLPGLDAAVIPFGVNLDRLPDRPLEKPSLTRPNLLFFGIDWERKGGATAVAVLDRLRAGGTDARLTIVGCRRSPRAQHPAVTFSGFLDKKRPRDLRRLVSLYRTAHLLVLPTQGDCAPMVLAEAMSHAVPVLATDTGGIAAMIGGGAAGRAMPLAAGPEIWAKTIRAMLEPAAYAIHSDAAFDRSQVFRWDVWAQGIVALARTAAARELCRAA